MSRRGVGILLILTAAIALGAIVQDARFDRLLETERVAIVNFDQRIADAEHLIDTLDGSRRAAVATDQMPGDWLDRASAPLADAEALLAAERAAAADAPTIAAIDTASAALAKFKVADSNGAVQDFHESLATARTAHRQHTNAGLLQLERLRLAMNAVAVLFTLAVAVYLGRVATVLGGKASSSTTQMLRDLPPPVKAGTLMTPAATAPAVAPAVQPAQAPAHRPSANLAAAAELCVDLANVVDAEDVPALLERAASVLDARGLVLWAIDSDGARLRAALSHGYPDRVLARLRPLQIDADNVTSLAFRSLQPQMMNGASTTDAAALAIPLMTGGGCVGVMAVELRHNRPHSDLLPVARIVGAQLSTLMTPADVTSRRTG